VLASFLGAEMIGGMPPTGRNEFVEFGTQRVSVWLEDDNSRHDVEASPTIGLDMVGLVDICDRPCTDALVVVLEDVALAGPSWGRHAVIRPRRVNLLLTRVHYAQ
jgi:hypothetical protein